MRNGILFNRVKVSHIIFSDPITDFVVFGGDFNNQSYIFKYSIPSISVGDQFEIIGSIIEDEQDLVVQVTSALPFIPKTIVDLHQYLLSLDIKGLCKNIVDKLVFGTVSDFFDLISAHRKDSIIIKGVPPFVIQQVIYKISPTISFRDSQILLNKLQLGDVLSESLIKHYGADLLSIVYADPYQLMFDINAVKFSLVDSIAMKLGLASNSHSRIEAMLYVLLFDNLKSLGSSYILLDSFVEISSSKLRGNYKIETILLRIWSLVIKGRIVIYSFDGLQCVSLLSDYQVEMQIAKHVRRLSEDISSARSQVDIRKYVKDRYNEGIKFTEGQVAALETLVRSNFGVLVGPPGTGKTFIVRHILRVLIEYGVIKSDKVAMAAPTGKSANVLSQATGRPVSTIHRLLRYHPDTDSFYYDEFCKMEDLEILIVDEFSMVDMYMGNSLLQSVSCNTQVILLGDKCQLQSVEKGCVLRDIVGHNGAVVCDLFEGKRFKNTSDIGICSKDIMNGFPPSSVNKKGGSFYFKSAVSVRDIESEILSYIEKTSKIYNLSPLDIQVLTPKVVGSLGSVSLSNIIKERFNPVSDVDCISYGGSSFSVNDRVVIQKNMYKKEVFNGDVGIIISVNSDDASLIVKCGKVLVTLVGWEIGQLTLSYALSIHKSQGSQYPVVIIPFHTVLEYMLYRSIIFTGVTRSQVAFVGIGSFDALCYGVNRDISQDRMTALSGHLSNTVNRISDFNTLLV
jgi:exodeoxyribonuclease V alpha subunit